LKITSGLKNGLTAYGDSEFSLFLRKAFIKALGYSDDALDRPIIGITNTFSDYNPCHGNVPQLIDAVKRGVMFAGGLPMVFPTISIHESFAHPTSMYLRNLMSMDTEEMVRAQPMDALVVIGGCDKTLPAQMMAAASVDLPTIVIPTGPMSVGHHRGELLGACTDCRRVWSTYRAGLIDKEEVQIINDRLVASVGTCTVMGTASTMACVCEAMGFTLPFGATIPATHSERLRFAENSGRCACNLAVNGPRPSELLSLAAFKNAMVVLQALGGSTNAIIHLAAIAGRMGRRFDLEQLDEIGRKVPVLVDLKPTGSHYMPHFHDAGGMPGLLSRLAGHLSLDAKTVSGSTLGEIIDGASCDSKIIRPIDEPVSAEGSIAVLFGNLAPRGAIIKQSAATESLMNHTGRAVVFESVEHLTKMIDDPDLEVGPHDILVLRGAGPVGGPGMSEAGYLPIPKKLAHAGVKDMIRISDARMSGTAFGTIVLHVTPEAAAGGPLALVATGDHIKLDVCNRRIDLLVEDGELQKRKKAISLLPERPQRGYAKLFADSVLQADDGCDFDFLTGSRKTSSEQFPVVPLRQSSSS